MYHWLVYWHRLAWMQINLMKDALLCYRWCDKHFDNRDVYTNGTARCVHDRGLCQLDVFFHHWHYLPVYCGINEHLVVPQLDVVHMVCLPFSDLTVFFMCFSEWPAAVLLSCFSGRLLLSGHIYLLRGPRNQEQNLFGNLWRVSVAREKETDCCQWDYWGTFTVHINIIHITYSMYIWPADIWNNADYGASFSARYDI